MTFLNAIQGKEAFDIGSNTVFVITFRAHSLQDSDMADDIYSYLVLLYVKDKYFYNNPCYG